MEVIGSPVATNSTLSPAQGEVVDLIDVMNGFQSGYFAKSRKTLRTTEGEAWMMMLVNTVGQNRAFIVFQCAMVARSKLVKIA